MWEVFFVYIKIIKSNNINSSCYFFNRYNVLIPIKTFGFRICERTEYRSVKNVIKRVSDEIFDNDTFTRIAESMHKQSKKLFSVVNSEAEAKQVQHDLNVNGYQANYEKAGKYYNVYYSPTTPKFKVDENVLKSFQNVGDNKYRAYKKSTVAGLYDYDFDDGSIWTLKTYEDGQQYLVKEVEDDNEDKVIRKKVASRNNIIKNDEFDASLSKFLQKKKIVVSSKLLSDIKQLIVDYALKENK